MRILSIFTALIQLALVARVLRWAGVRVALLFLPAVALGGYGLIALIPALSMIRVVKIAENSTDYSMQKTATQVLFLPTSREAKYKAKAAIDTFFQRAGDVFSAGLVGIASMVVLSFRSIALINLALIALWVTVAIGLGRRHQRLTEKGEERRAA